MQFSRRSRLAWSLVLALALPALPGRGQGERIVVKIREQRLPVETGAGPRVDRPYFDAAGRLAWNGSPSSRPGEDVCPGGGAPAHRATVLVAPRVDEVHCAGGGSTAGAAFLLGVGAGGRASWRRPLGLRSGKFTFGEIVVGATREGIVLNNLTVLAPASGKVLYPPPTHPVDREARPVPDHDLAQATIYLPDRRVFVTFDAEVSLFQRSGGVYLLDPKTGQRDLLLPVSSTLLGGHWRVETMALAAGHRYLLLGHRFAFRGPGGVSLAVFDLAERRTVYEERFIEDHYGGGLALAVDDRGNVGFSFLDETAGRRVLVHYRVPPAPTPPGRRSSAR